MAYDSEQQALDDAIAQLVRLARLSEPIDNNAIDSVVESYLAGVTKNKFLEREKLGNAFDERFSRKSERTIKIYRRVKRIE